VDREQECLVRNRTNDRLRFSGRSCSRPCYGPVGDEEEAPVNITPACPRVPAVGTVPSGGISCPEVPGNAPDCSRFFFCRPSCSFPPPVSWPIPTGGMVSLRWACKEGSTIGNTLVIGGDFTEAGGADVLRPIHGSRVPSWCWCD